MSNRDVQPIKFACPSCGEGIEITISEKNNTTIKGAERISFDGPCDGVNK